MSGLGLQAVVRALGGDLYAGGARACIPGPGHSPADRSVSLAVVDGRVLIHCFAGDDWRRVRDDLFRRGFLDQAGRLIGGSMSASEPMDARSPPALAPNARVRIARRLWFEAGSLGASAAARHLARRGLAGVRSAALRVHAAVPAAIYRDLGPRRPALLAAICDTGGEVCGVEVTYLSADGRRANMRTPRKTVGSRPAGSAVRLSPPQCELLVGEGVITTLSAGVRFRRPAWALMSAANLASWTPPPGVRRVLVAVDRDATGWRAARTLRRRLGSLDVACELCWPPAPHADWNEALLAEREREEGRSGAGAADGWSGPPARRSSR